METGRCSGIEIKVEETKVIGMTRRPSPVLIRRDLKQINNMEYFNYLGSVITNNLRCTRAKLNTRLPWQRQHSTRRRLFSSTNWT
jgi:hypothetical protein